MFTYLTRDGRLRRSGPAYSAIGPRAIRDNPWISATLPIAAFLILFVPVAAALARWSWPTDEGAHGPIVLVTGAWLLYRRRSGFKIASPYPPIWIVTPLLFVSLAAYTFARITSLLFLEVASLYVATVLSVILYFGHEWIRKTWFALIYLLFVIPIPPNTVTAATQPAKFFISAWAVRILSTFGYDVGRNGVVLQIDQYQLLVATACTGVNSLIGISALCVFYIHLRHGHNWRLAGLMLFCILPIGLALNLLRVLALILQTHYFGEAVSQGAVHQIDGLVMFVGSFLFLFILERPLTLLSQRLGQTHGPSA